MNLTQFVQKYNKELIMISAIILVVSIVSSFVVYMTDGQKGIGELDERVVNEELIKAYRTSDKIITEIMHNQKEIIYNQNEIINTLKLALYKQDLTIKGLKNKIQEQFLDINKLQEECN